MFVLCYTSIQAALHIIKNHGLMLATEKHDAPGGQGVYGFKVEDYSDMNSCMDAFRSTQSGGYNKGAGIIFRTHGLVFNSCPHDIIPKGS